MFKKGFTLAEVLITLVIIGVVATMTIPTLNQNIANKKLETQTLKFYNQLIAATTSAFAQNPTGIVVTDAFIRENFNVINVCDSSNRDKCLGSELGAADAVYNTLNDGTTYNVTDIFPTTSNIYVLGDGSMFRVSAGSPSTVVFDVNGPATPNTYGRDLWKVAVFSDGSIDNPDVTPARRKTASPTALNYLVSKAFERCQDGMKDESETSMSDFCVQKVNKMFGNPGWSENVIKVIGIPSARAILNQCYAAGENGKPVSSCFGHFMRNNFKFDY